MFCFQPAASVVEKSKVAPLKQQESGKYSKYDDYDYDEDSAYINQSQAPSLELGDSQINGNCYYYQ